MYKDLFEKIQLDENLKQRVEERIDKKMERKNKKMPRFIAVAACLILTLLVSVTAVASYRFLSAKNVARELNDNKLASYFTDDGGGEPVSDGGYTAALLGFCSGDKLSDHATKGWNISSEKTYAAVAVARTDGEPMSYDDDIFITPLIQGLEPWKYNIFTMNGGKSSIIIDGVLYNIIDCDTLEYFADRALYLGVLGGSMNVGGAYAMDGATGEISPKPDYDGVNILLPLPIDASKADPEKAEEYLSELNGELFGSAETDGGETTKDAGDFKIDESEENADGETAKLITIR